MNTSYETAALPDPELLANLETLSIKETQSTVEILLYLGEVERRKLYLEAGYSSMFAFCTQGNLRYSESARAVAKFPELVDELLSKRLSLTTLSLVAAELTSETVAEIVAAIGGKSRDEVERYRSTLRPKQEPPREKIRPVAVAKKPAVAEEMPLFSAAKSEEASAGGELSVIPTAAGEGKEPEGELRYELKLMINAEDYAKLNEVSALLLAKYPRGVGVEQVLKEGLELLLEKLSPRKRHERRQRRVERKQADGGSEPTREVKPSRNIPAAIRDAVYVRDGGCCTYTSPDGAKCGETAGLELHHELPFGKSGTHEIENLRLLCRRHNAYQAVKDYGKPLMRNYLNLT